MDKNAWFSYVQPLVTTFTDSRCDSERGKYELVATFGCLLSQKYIGRAAFQSIYDLVSSWQCWDLSHQAQDWETIVRYEVQTSQVSADSIPQQTSTCATYTVETDEQCVNTNCITTSRQPNEEKQLHLKSTTDALEMNKITVTNSYVDNNLFKLVPKATFGGIEVVKKKTFHLKTHLHWEYEFSLVWSSPFLDELESPSGLLVFKQEPKCEFKIKCKKRSEEGVETPTNWHYVAESFLLKLHDTIPSAYRSSDGSSVSLPPTTS